MVKIRLSAALKLRLSLRKKVIRGAGTDQRRNNWYVRLAIHFYFIRTHFIRTLRLRLLKNYEQFKNNEQAGCKDG